MNNKKITNGTKYDYMTPDYWAAYKKRKPIVIREEQKTSILPAIGWLAIGWLAIGLAVIDFVANFISYYLFVTSNSKTFVELKLPDTATALVEFIEGHVRILIIIAKYSLTEPGVIVFGLIGIALLIKSKVKKI